VTERILLGTQSWNFKAWVGPFYPVGARSSRMLGFYGLNFPTIEVDSTFYGVPSETVLSDWRAQVPPGFLFALKLPQQITHDARLKETDELLQKFSEGVSVLGEQLGPCLIQLSPDFLPTPENRAAFRAFLPSLPSHIRWAVEFRHPGWSDDSVLELLGSYGVAHALVDGRWYPRAKMIALAENPTADFAYIRWMGKERRLTDYSRPQVDRDEERRVWGPVLERLSTRVDRVFGFFNNQFEGHSPHSAREMQRALGRTAVDPISLHPQAELFKS
jgi:uncharacterized protein YecE (DUF72 family)